MTTEEKTPTIQDLKSSFEETRRTWETEYKGAVKRGEEERKEFGTQLGLTKEKLERMDSRLNSYEQSVANYQAQLKAAEAKQAVLESTLTQMMRPGVGGRAGEPEVREELKGFYSEAKAFSKYVQRGERGMSVEELKSLATDNTASGGYLLPVNVAAGIIERLVLTSPIRTVATVQSLASGDNLDIIKEGTTAFSCGWTTERGARTESTAGTFALDKLPVHEMYAMPYVTRKMLDDVAFDVESYVNRKIAEQFGKLENTAFVAGTGVGQPEGIIVNPTALAAATSVATGGAFTAAQLMTFQDTLNEPYRSAATWLTKMGNFSLIRQLAGSVSVDFLWQPGLQAGMPSMLLGRPILPCNDFTLIGSAAASGPIIAYGDWANAYWIVDRIGISQIRDELTAKPYVLYYTTKRTGGQVVNTQALVIGTKNA